MYSAFIFQTFLEFICAFDGFCRCLHPSYRSLSCLMQSVLQRLMFSKEWYSRTHEVNDDLMNTYDKTCMNILMKSCKLY